MNFFLRKQTANTISYLTDTETWAAACSPSPTATRKGQINSLISNIQGDGYWSGLDWLLIVGETEQMWRVNIANPSKTMTAVNSIESGYVADRGAPGDGISMHYSLGEALSAGSNWSLNSAAFGVWCNQDNGGSTSPPTGTNNAGRAVISARRTPGNETFQINDSTADVSQGNPGTRLGHRAASRTATGVKRFYFNGVLTADKTTASALVTNTTHYLLRNGSNYGIDRIAAFWSGAGLNQTGMAAIHARIGAHLTAIGAI